MLLISLGPALDIALANLIIAGGAAAQAAIGMGVNTPPPERRWLQITA